MIKRLSDYQKLAITTATYPEQFKIIYPTLEMVDETQEFASAHGRDNEILELGDCFWPFANLVNELELDMESIYDDAIDSFREVLYTDKNDALSTMRAAAAQICGRVKKWLRDEDPDSLPSDEKMMDIEFSLISYLAAMLFICTELGVSWNTVTQLNIDKLFDRKNRDMIKGSGDNR